MKEHVSANLSKSYYSMTQLKELVARLLDDFNLLVSTSRGNERNTCSELWYLLGELGDKDARVDVTPAIGLVVAKTILDPVDVVHKLRTLLKERPWEFRYTLKVTPVQKLVQTDIEEIKKTSADLACQIAVGETFRVSVEKRHTDISGREIIEVVANCIDRKVNLERPDRIILVEVLGRFSGISILRPDDILSTERERRSL